MVGFWRIILTDDLIMMNALDNGYQYSLGVGAARSGRWLHTICTGLPSMYNCNFPRYQYLYCYSNGRFTGGYGIWVHDNNERTYSRMGTCAGESLCGGGLDGLVDSFQHYDVTFYQEQVSVHFTVSHPPIFELVFSVDPRSEACNGEHGAMYSWNSVDSGDFDGLNNGVLTFNGRNQFINVALSRGPNSVCTTLNAVSPEFSRRGYNTGMTIELLFRLSPPFNQSIAETVYDLGRGVGVDNIALLMDNRNSSNNTLRFRICLMSPNCSDIIVQFWINQWPVVSLLL